MRRGSPQKAAKYTCKYCSTSPGLFALPPPEAAPNTLTPALPAHPALKTPAVEAGSPVCPWPRNGRQTTGRSERGSAPCRRPAVALNEQLGLDAAPPTASAWQPSRCCRSTQPPTSLRLPTCRTCLDKDDMDICVNMRWPNRGGAWSAWSGRESTTPCPLSPIPIRRLAPPIRRGPSSRCATPRKEMIPVARARHWPEIDHLPWQAAPKSAKFETSPQARPDWTSALADRCGCSNCCCTPGAS